MRLRNQARILILAALLSACGGAADHPGAGPTASGAQSGATEAAVPSFRIVGYATDWEGSPDPAQIEKLTHINYAFLLPKPDGSITGIENSSKLEQIVEQAHVRGVKALISVGGWGADADFEAMAANADAAKVDDIEYHGKVEHYNGMPTIQRKTVLAIQRASGIMIWALAHDTNDSTSLLGAIYATAHAPGQP